MNLERMIQLRDAIAAAPPAEFRYDDYFSDRGGMFEPVEVPKPHCGTAGCVAGWACMLFRPREMVRAVTAPSDDLSILNVARTALDLDLNQASFLFLENCAIATREDALKRLNWMIEHANYAEIWDPNEYYPWDNETWCRNPSPQV